MAELSKNGASNNHQASTINLQETLIPDTLHVEPESFELRILDPKRMRVFRHAGIPRLTLRDDRSWYRVAVARAFPLSDPDHYLGFLDGDGKDIGLLQDPSQLDPESRQVVEEELEKRYFVPVVEKVVSVKEEFGTVYWTVETDRGQRDIIVRNLRDNLQELSASRVIITDVDGNRFEFADVSRMDSKTQGVILRNL